MLSQFDACSQAHGTNCASIYAPPQRCLASLDLILPRVVAVLHFFVPSSLSPGLRQPGDGTPLRSDRRPSASALCDRSSLTPKTTTPQQRPSSPLRYANSAGRSTQPTGRALRSCVSPGHLPGLRSRSRTTCSLRLSRHSLRRRRTTLALRLSADHPQAERLLSVLESGQSPSFHSGPSPASAVLINHVPLSMDRTAPHFVRHRTVHSAPFIVTLQRNRTQKTPAGSDSYCAPFPLRNKSRTPLPWEKPSGNPGRDPGGPGNRPLLPPGYYPGHAPACPPAWSAPGNLSHSKLKTLLPKTPAATNRSGLLSGSHPATAA